LLNGKDIIDLIPSMKLPMSGISPDIQKQSLTGRTCQMDNIPLSVQIMSKQLYNNEEIVYKCTVSIYTNISGLVTVRSNDFQINSYNATFARLLFGYNESELLNKPITQLIPNFFELSTTSTAKPLNKPLYTNSTNKSQKLISNLPEKKQNDNGSFLESKLVSSTTPASTATTPKKIIISSMKPDKEEEDEADQDANTVLKCSNCQRQLRQRPTNNTTHQLSKKSKLNQDLLADFNLNNECGDYSPNRKCANYIETNSFSPKSAGGPSSSATPKSAIKKSLLAKAIKNNSNISRADSPLKDIKESTTTSPSPSPSPSESSTSILDVSNSSTTTSCKSLAMSLFSKLEVSEFEDEKDDDDEDDCDKITVEIENQEGGNREEDKREDDIVFEGKKLCSKCAIIENTNVDQSEVSLIAIDNEDQEHEEEEADDNDDDNNDIIAHDRLESLKRKATTDNLLAKEETHDEDEVEDEKLTQNTTNHNDSINKKFKNQITSTPAQSITLLNLNKHKLQSAASGIADSTGNPNTNDGIYFGNGRHSDGSLIKLIYQRKSIKLKTDKENENDKENEHSSIKANLNNNLICIWVSRDPYSDKPTMDCSTLDQSHLLSQSMNLFRSNNVKLNQTLSTVGPSSYLCEYEDLRTLGRGASGFVQLARRKKLDKFEVVTKYILKSRIYRENWIDDTRYGTIPLEISILCKLDHVNIVRVLEVFQDTDHVQMVMQKHGLGMDLFEFIDRQRRFVNERLTSYIFRQIVSAVAYLHVNDIVHRDIKDENIVINEKFQIKLIDFGSATHVVKGKKFATFCGTIDYCSPDVLLGNKYYGPELDCWTCGIALYTLVFSENPFFDAEETIECILKPPFRVSKDLMKLLFSILCPNPEQRATIIEIEANPWVTQPVDITLYKWEEVIRNTEFHANNAGDINLDEEYANLCKYDGTSVVKPLPRTKPLQTTTNHQENNDYPQELNNNPNDVIDMKKQNKISDHLDNDCVNMTTKKINQQTAINLLMSKSF
jgi:PAS domain-containing serine/threonine kinase